MMFVFFVSLTQLSAANIYIYICLGFNNVIQLKFNMYFCCFLLYFVDFVRLHCLVVENMCKSRE